MAQPFNSVSLLRSGVTKFYDAYLIAKAALTRYVQLGADAHHNVYWFKKNDQGNNVGKDVPSDIDINWAQFQNAITQLRAIIAAIDPLADDIAVLCP